MSCRLQNPSQHSKRHKPTAIARVTFSLHQGANKKKKASEQYNFYHLDYTLILKTVPQETFYKSEQQLSSFIFLFLVLEKFVYLPFGHSNILCNDPMLV